ncbi:hypothetical protein [Citrobacter europaeus]|jgi:hypothetical protein|uniref:hypothetical protein n=1 Tax=Citrobacter europaeus TaxID=1914243 RepID=UPI00049EDA0D|nr:hypothetical protein AF42_01688 [Citrobacter freundii MGH 56]
MKSTIVLTGVTLCCLLLSGCSGARVVETTTTAGTTLSTVRVSGGTELTFNQQSGLLCIDATGSGACSHPTESGK